MGKGELTTSFVKQEGRELIDKLAETKTAERIALLKGPLPKVTYTEVLEDIVKAFLSNKAGKSDETVTFAVDNDTLFATLKGKTINVSEAIINANLNHFVFDAETTNDYLSFINGTDCYYEPRLKDVDGIPTDEDYKKQERASQFPDALNSLNLAEKSAINIYTGAFYKDCNPLLRGDLSKFDPDRCGEILATTAFICTGLNRVNNIPRCKYELKTDESVLIAGTMHVTMHEGFFEYSTLDPSGQPVIGIIDQNELPSFKITKETAIDKLRIYTPEILAITANRGHSPKSNVPLHSFRLEENKSEKLIQERIKAVNEGGFVSQETSFYSSAAGLSQDESVAEMNKELIDMGAGTGIVFSDLRGKYIAGVSRKPDEMEYLIPPSQMQWIYHSQNEAGGHIFYARPVQTLTGLSKKQVHREQAEVQVETTDTFVKLKEEYKSITEHDVAENTQDVKNKL